MSTFLYSLAEGAGSRLEEISSIVSRAENAFDQDDGLYNILCRSGCVLLVSALEGFLKDINVALQSDLNSNITSFAGMPSRMKREFSKKIVYYEDVPDREIDKRAIQLVRFFELNSVKIDMGAFSYKENPNKNPNGYIVDSSFTNYGINSVLHCMLNSRFEAIFKNDKVTDFILKREIKSIRSTLYKYPYSKLPSKFVLVDWIPQKGQVPPNSIWHTFLENVLRRRHSVVHADTMENPTSWQALADDVKKMEILFYGIIFSVSSVLVGKS